MSDRFLNLIKNATVSTVASDFPDLSQRQLGIFLTVALDQGPHTVRGLARTLNVSKPAVTRALDRLAEFRLTARHTDPLDRRSVNVSITTGGSAHLAHLRHIAVDAAARAVA